MTDYLELNRSNWEARVPFHEQGYGLERFRDDRAYLSDAVRFDLPRLGDVAGKDVLHLQCHLGHDTPSLARLGARVIGLDFSPSSLEGARRLAADCGADIAYVEADVYDGVAVLGAARFDLVYTGIGALNWLPSVEWWAQVVSGLLRPGGELFVREGHPMLFALDVDAAGAIGLSYPYFEAGGAIRGSEEHTYVEHDGVLSQPETVQWNHGLGEIFMALQAAGLRMTLLEEHDAVPWDALPGLLVEDDAGQFRLREHPERLAATFTLRAVKE